MAQKRLPQHMDESAGEKKKRAAEILSILSGLYPAAECHINYRSPYELLIASILSAQCTDKRVNRITPALFAKYPSPRDFAQANPEELERDIFSTGFYRAKASSIIGCSRDIEEKHGGEVPATMEELTSLRGVGRKTANVVLGNAFGVPGIIVDTHIKRLANRLMLSSSKNPEQIERDLMELIPQRRWTYFSNALGDHGRTVCKARKPNCGECKINRLCPSAELDN